MRNKHTNTVKKSNESLVVAFQDFNGVFLARISNKSKSQQTHGVGHTKASAQINAIKLYKEKYNICHA